MNWLLGPYTEARTYRAIGYFLLGLPLAIFEFTVMVTGLSLGLGLLVTILGIPVLVATLLVARSLATVERRLAKSLLEAPLPRRQPSRREATGIFWPRLRSQVSSQRTRAEVAFLLLRLPIGILDFTFITTLIALAVGGLAQPIVVAAGVHSEIGTWTIDTIPESFIFLPISILFLLVGPRLILGWSRVSRRFALHFLGRIDTADLKREIGQILAQSDEADAFHIFNELELRLGRGPFLTPTRVQATLLALDESGHLSVRRHGRNSAYSLT